LKFYFWEPKRMSGNTEKTIENGVNPPKSPFLRGIFRVYEYQTILSKQPLSHA
jgi:hypothetical protein